MSVLEERIYGTCVARGTRGALLRGPSGAGKSDLALRFLMGQNSNSKLSGAVTKNERDGAFLVSDDQVIVQRDKDKLIARAPATIQGKLEVRGIGIIACDFLEQAELKLIVDLVRPEQVPRMAEAPLPTEDVLGVDVPILQLAPHQNSSPIKLWIALGILSHRSLGTLN